MVRALRVISIERGLDPRAFTLVAFGGAGGMHACALAEELELSAVLVPRASGVLSALGLAISDLRRDYVAALVGALDDLDAGELEAVFAGLEGRAASDLPGSSFRRFADLRYRGQSFELTVPAEDAGGLGSRFAAAHLRRYGFELPGEEVEVVSVRLTATASVPKPALAGSAALDEPAARTRRAYFDGAWREVDVLRRDELDVGARIDGPAVVEFPEATCVVRPGWSAVVDLAGALSMERA